MNEKTLIIRVYGIVQGVGFRPTVARIAEKNQIRGTVSNCGPYVEIYAHATDERLAAFKKDISENPPERSVILRIEEETAEQHEFDDFRIIESSKTSGELFIPPDIAICDKCSEELFDKKNRRYLHPFINCTQCGPRLTILEKLPYDRCRTSMKKFPMCPECAEEYENPESRRFDAQPVCCNDCGPKVYSIDCRDGKKSEGLEAISLVRKIISEGGIAAVKGIGGFHLCCDAANEDAVKTLRQRKSRPVKPFAVMLKDKETLLRETDPGDDAEELLKIISGHQKPIVLIPKAAGSKIADSVAPGSRKVGVMLPYAPVQLLLFSLEDGVDMPDALVMTSGNVSGAPICRTDEEALSEIAGFCDIILSNDRDIRTRADDSVMDFYKGEPYMIRRSRGYAPLPFHLTGDFNKNVLAVGGELKNTFCIAKGNLLYPSAYIGDLADIRSQQALEETIGRMEEMLEVKADTVACDLHPAYYSTAIAERAGRKVVRVQHHYAHILSCMAENDYLEDLIGAAYDGTGYGTDGTIWGGEIMQAGLSGFERLFSIRPFSHVGGDSASKEGWKIAVSMLDSILEDEEALIKTAESLDLCRSSEALVISRMKKNGLNSVRSTSAGRLFDAVSALLGIVRKSTFEGEASMALQTAAESYRGNDFKKYELKISDEGLGILPTDELFSDILEMKKKGEETEKIAYFFHASLAAMTAEAVVRAGEAAAVRTAALSGGVFQNLLLLRLTEEELERRKIKVLRHSLIPPNDGGIAVGQALAAVSD